MRRISLEDANRVMRVLPFYLFIFVLLLMTSCSGRSGYFKMEGRFMHLNQGEIYVYSPDGVIMGMDTIRIEAGRFAYEVPCKEKGMLIIVFPNYSEHAIFAEPGEAVSVKADASHLKEMEVEGSEDNELMTSFRKMVSEVSPPEEVKMASQFIQDHPDSYVGLFLVRKYFLQGYTPDYKQAAKLLGIMEKEQGENIYLKRLKTQVQSIETSLVGAAMPAFSAKDIDGNPISHTQLKSGLAIVHVWSIWNSLSHDMLRVVRQAYSRHRVKAATICIDPVVGSSQRQTMERDTVVWPVICDGQLIESPMMKKLGLSRIPEAVIYQNGRVVARVATPAALREKLNELVK